MDSFKRGGLTVEQFVQSKLDAIKRTKFLYDCSLCLLIRDENEYLEEWLRWHIGQGVQHFYIYDNKSKQPVSGLIAGLEEGIRQKVTVVDWGGTYRSIQVNAYNDCLAWYGSESRWIGFIDSDEFVRVKTGQKLPEFLKSYENYAGLFMVWIMYGADGQVKKSALPVRQRFQKVSPSTACHGMGKVFVQPMLMRDMIIHNGHPAEGFIVVDEKKQYVDEAHLWVKDSTTDLICVDHYITKSYEEWIEKLKRGTTNPQHCREYKEFFDYNPDMISCREEVYPTQRYGVSMK